MKNIFLTLITAMLLFIPGCQAESQAAVVGHEFLSPRVAVVKCDGFMRIRSSSIPIEKIGFWKKENALARDEKGNILPRPETTVYLYIQLAKPLQDKEELILQTSCGEVKICYFAAIPTNIFKLNQLGNGGKQPQKYAYMGAWLGDAGAMPLKEFDGKIFELRQSSNHRCVFQSTMKVRKDDPLYQGKTPFTGEEVLELDYSKFNTPGKYYLYVENIGRSIDFVIGSQPLNEAFYIHARGLYHKRCGIALTEPFTFWQKPECHTIVFQGRFPGNADHYRKGKEKDHGFFDRRGNRIGVKHFELIKANPPYKSIPVKLRGGWHDAADYDRRPYHLRIVSDLAAVYLMKPANFIDGQLNIPESGNGIPDILDEAAWGLEHLLAIQQSNGGVGCWFESDSHPGAGEGLPDQDKRVYYVSAPDRNGTLEYAAAAAIYALALNKAGFPDRAQKYIASAVKAWDFAMDKRNLLVAYFQLKGTMIHYMEEPYLYGENLLRAGAALYTLTGEEKYLTAVVENESQIRENFNQDFWKWSPLSWMILELFPVKELAFFRTEYRKVIVRNGEKMLKDLENGYPYRSLWHAPDATWVHAMAWGNYHPLRRAVTLIAAHKLTGEEKFLAGAYLANDFHNGANPLGRSMTSGLGKIFPAVFLDLVSYADDAGEFVPGITPYGNTFGIDRKAVDLVYGKRAEDLPIFRRYVNLEFSSVPASEYSVWETIAPAAVTTGYLIEKPVLPPAEWKNRKPAANFRKLPGYLALP